MSLIVNVLRVFNRRFFKCGKGECWYRRSDVAFERRRIGKSVYVNVILCNWGNTRKDISIFKAYKYRFGLRYVDEAVLQLIWVSMVWWCPSTYCIVYTFEIDWITVYFLREWGGGEHFWEVCLHVITALCNLRRVVKVGHLLLGECLV